MSESTDQPASVAEVVAANRETIGLGHSNGLTRRGERCPRRPDACDPNSKADPPSYWGGAGFGEVSGDE